MRPEDITNRDFMVGLRGYDRDEVRSFLDEVAHEFAVLLGTIESSAPAEPAERATDEFESLGAGVAAILRAANEDGVTTHFIEDEHPQAEQQIPRSLEYLAALTL